MTLQHCCLWQHAVKDLSVLLQEEAEGIKRVEGAMVRSPGDRLAASYANFYIPNGGVVTPALGNAAADQR